MQKFLVLCCSAILLSASVLAPRSSGQQDKSQRPSPPAQAQFSFADGKTVTTSGLERPRPRRGAPAQTKRLHL